MANQVAHGRCFCGGVEYRIELPRFRGKTDERIED